MASEYENLTAVATVGEGRFGTIQLVRHSDNADYFALRVTRQEHDDAVSKMDTGDTDPSKLASLTSPLIVRFFVAFGDENHAYLLLESAAGEELARLFADESQPQDTSSRFFVASIIEAFDQMCHRVLIYKTLANDGGFPRVHDLGFGKWAADRVANGCGAVNQAARKDVDWWILGILIYEMLSSYPPFYDEDPMKTYAKIMRAKISSSLLPEQEAHWRRYA